MDTTLDLQPWTNHLRECRAELFELVKIYRTECAKQQQANPFFAVLYVKAKQNKGMEQQFPLLYACEDMICRYIQWVVTLEVLAPLVHTKRMDPTTELKTAIPARTTRNARHQLVTPWYRFIYLLDYELN